MRFRQYFGGLSLLAFLRQYADAIVRESFNEPRMNDVETIRAQAAPAVPGETGACFAPRRHAFRDLCVHGKTESAEKENVAFLQIVIAEPNIGCICIVFGPAVRINEQRPNVLNA